MTRGENEEVNEPAMRRRERERERNEAAALSFSFSAGEPTTTGNTGKLAD